MPETTNRVLLKIDFEGSSAIKTTADLKKALEGLQSERQKLLDKVKEGNLISEKERVQLELLNAQIKENQRETRTVTKFIDDSIKARKAETDSIESNRAELSKLTAEYIKTGKPTQDQTNKIKTLSDTLKKQESALGDNRRNVGNYADSLSGLGGPIGSAITGVKGFNTALSANPIGAIVLLVVQLGAQLIKLKPVADFLEAAFAGLSAGFDAFVSSIGKFLSGDFAGAFSDFGNTISTAVKNANDLARALQDVNDQERQVLLISSKAQTQIDQLLLQSKNRSISEQERINLLDKASKLEEDVLTLELANAKERERIQTEKNNNILKTRQLTDEESQALIDAQLKVEELNRNSIVLQEKIQNRKDALLDQADKKSQQFFEAEQKRINDDLELRKKATEEFKSIDRAFRDEIKKQEEKNKKLADKKAKDDIERQSNQIDADIDLSNKRADQRKQLADSEVELEKAKFEAINGLIDLASAAAGQNSSIQAVLFGLQKAVAISEIIINLQRQFSANATYGATLGPAGVAYTAITNTTAAIRAATGIATITSQAIPQIQKLEEGGGVKAVNIEGKSHAQGGEDVIVGGKRVANIEGGENMYILKKSAAHYINKLSGLNQSFGGASFGGPASRYLASGGLVSDGGFAQRSIAAQVDQQLSNSQLERAFRNMPQPVVRVTDIQRVSSGLNNSVNVSEL